MKSKRSSTTVTQKGWGGLKYVEVHKVPVEKSEEFGELMDASVLKQMEHRIAEEILLQHRPIHGQEVIFFRKVFGMSRREFAKEIGLSDVGVLKWEHALRKRLTSMSEIAVRVYFAKKLELKLDEVMTPLIPEGKALSKLKVEFHSSKQEHEAA